MCVMNWKLLVIFFGQTLIMNDVAAYTGSTGNYNTIPIGLLTDQYVDDHYLLSTIFERAIEEANVDLKIQLVPITVNFGNGDAFEGYRKVCQMLQNGVSAIFGPASIPMANHLTSICDAADIPHFVSSPMSYFREAFNLSPYPNDISRVIYDLTRTYEWIRFVFLYESVEYLRILNGLVALFKNNGPMISVLKYDTGSNGNYKPILRRIRKSADNRIIVAGSIEVLPELLKQAQQVGLINEDYMFVFCNLDFHSLNLVPYKYSEANITSIRALSIENPTVLRLVHQLGYAISAEQLRNGTCPITMQMALLYDAVQLFAETAKHLNFRSTSINCSDRIQAVKDDGSTFKNYIRSVHLNKRTLTGRIYFDETMRMGIEFDVLELQPSGLTKVGTWKKMHGYIRQRMAPTNYILDIAENSLANKTFTVLLSVPNKPYASLVESYEKLEGNSQYEGYGVDLIKELSEKLGFNFTLINGSSDYGSYNKTSNVSTGMLKEIMEGRADLAITDLTITSEREEAIDFSIPFMNLGIAILYLKPQKSPPALFTFMDPFSEEVWMFLGLSFLGVSLSFFVLGRLSPTEWQNPYPCVTDPTALVNQFTIGNSLWFTTGALLQQGSEIGPRALSTRIVASTWWFFTLIMVSSYTANLAAFLTIERPTSLIDSIDDLAENKGGVVYGAKQTGSTRNFFLTAEDERYRKMNKFMTIHPELLTDSNSDGVNRVKAGTNYAFLMESTSIEYNTVRECNLKKIGESLDEKGYGIAMRKNWPHRDKFNNALLLLQEQGVLEKMKNKWWNEVGAGICASGGDELDATPLAMDNLEGVYIVLLAGSCFALFCSIFSWIIFVIKKAEYCNMSKREAFMEEFCIVFALSAQSREVDNEALHTTF